MTSDIKGPVYFPLALGICYSAAAMRMKGFLVHKPSAFRPIAHEGIHFVAVVLCIRINGSTPILILCCLV